MNTLRFFFAFLSFVAASSAAAPPTTQPYIFHLPGISGPLAVDRAFSRGLVLAHLPAPEIYDWTCNDPGLHALNAYQRNQQQAEIVARKITDVARAHPGTPIILTGHSGGTGIAVWALEKCPPDVQVLSLVMIASGLSPRYDLSPALAHVTGHAFAFTSVHDDIVLGAGTRLLGTIDRVHTDAAGRVGFTAPDHPADPAQYAKLVPMPFRDEYLQYGNAGDHIGAMTRLFASQIIAPLIGGSPPSMVTPASR